ncbi:MAG: hypothetical protein QXX47_04110 [Sulfolobales archaeon]
MSIEGRTIETCRDTTTGLIICPICTDISRICPSDREYGSITPDKAVYFFTEDDLRNHIEAHSRSSEWGKITTFTEESEEEEEEEE